MSVLRWLLDSDRSIRWQVIRDLIGARVEEIPAERARLATEGVGAQLLALQGADGRWGGAAWNRGWDSTMHVLMLLRDMGLDPASDQARRAVDLVYNEVKAHRTAEQKYISLQVDGPGGLASGRGEREGDRPPRCCEDLNL